MAKLNLTNAQITKKRDDAEKSCWNRAAAYIILHPDKPGNWGVIRVAKPAPGGQLLTVFLWDMSATGVQIGSSGKGYGFNRLAEALDGLTFDGILLSSGGDGWETQLRNAGYSIIQAL